MSDTAALARALDDWAESEWADGVQLDAVQALDALSVRTRNSTYEIVVTSPASGDALVRGGARFPTFTPVRICGSTTGGSLLKLAGVYCGLRLELECNGRRVLTSTVQSVDRIPFDIEH